MTARNVKGLIYRLWELLVIRWVLVTGKGKRRREWIHYRRSMGARKGAVTKKRMKEAARAGAAEGNQAEPAVSSSFTPEPGQSAPYEDHDSDAVQLA
jgi:hypothetical protein